jgi:hypothetical protein
MRGARRFVTMALLAVYAVAVPLFLCDCLEMAAPAARAGHCETSGDGGPALGADCHCVCMTSRADVAAAFLDASASTAAPAPPAALAPHGRPRVAAVKETSGPGQSPPRLARPVLRV